MAAEIGAIDLGCPSFAADAQRLWFEPLIDGGEIMSRQDMI
jgi:hypothetical protein